MHYCPRSLLRITACTHRDARTEMIRKARMSMKMDTSTIMTSILDPPSNNPGTPLPSLYTLSVPSGTTALVPYRTAGHNHTGTAYHVSYEGPRSTSTHNVTNGTTSRMKRHFNGPQGPSKSHRYPGPPTNYGPNSGGNLSKGRAGALEHRVPPPAYYVQSQTQRSTRRGLRYAARHPQSRAVI